MTGNQKIILPVVLIVIFAQSYAWAQPEYPLYRKADKEFDLGQFQDAETYYRKVDEIKSKAETSYNLGNSIYLQNRMPEAVTQYQKAIENSKDPGLKSDAYYNMGNAHYQNKEYDEAIRNYKESLKLRPDDEYTKKNLMLAMRQLQQQQQQQQNKDQQKKDENKDKDKKDQQQQDQKQQSDKDKKDQQQQDQQQQQQNQQQQDQQQPQETKQDISKDEAKEILKAVEREDQRVQEKLKKVPARSGPPAKDW